MATETFDVTARKAHQWTMVALVVAGFLLGNRVGPILVAVAGLIMLAGRFWWPADLVRQLTWRLLEPWGLLRRRASPRTAATASSSRAATAARRASLSITCA